MFSFKQAISTYNSKKKVFIQELIVALEDATEIFVAVQIPPKNQGFTVVKPCLDGLWYNGWVEGYLCGNTWQNDLLFLAQKAGKELDIMVSKTDCRALWGKACPE